MRIVAVAHFYIEHNRAGGEMMLHRILKELAKEHTVTVLVTDGEGTETEIDGVNVQYDNQPQIRLHGIRPDVIMSHFHRAPEAFRAAQDMLIPFIYLVHNDVKETARMLGALRAYDLAIYNTEWIARKLLTRAKSVIVHPPIDMPTFQTSSDSITLVNLTPAKGAETFYALAERMPHRQFLAVQGGYAKDQQIIKILPNVMILDNTDKMENVYAASKVVLMPSIYETFGMVAAEAARAGVPTIAHPTVGLIENLGPGGIFIDRQDIDRWVVEIEKLFEDPEYYQHRQQSALESTYYYDRSQELEDLNNLVRDLMFGKR